MREGDYDHPIPASGPLEIRRSSEEANELARTLHRLSHDNRTLLHKIVSLQDDERRDIARELHDELGPLLFGIRANTVALLEAVPPDQAGLDGPRRESCIRSRRCSRPIAGSSSGCGRFYIEELGLERSIQTLLRNAQTQVPGPQTDVIHRSAAERSRRPALANVYRVIQEGDDQRPSPRQGRTQ